MRAGISPYTQPERWATHQVLLQLFRDFDTLQRLRPYLVSSSMAYRRLEREQARIEVAMSTMRQQMKPAY